MRISRTWLVGLGLALAQASLSVELSKSFASSFLAVIQSLIP